MFPPKHGDNRYTLFDNSIFFIPEYMYRALESSGLSIANYIKIYKDLIAAIKEDGTGRSYNLSLNRKSHILVAEESEDISANTKALYTQLVELNKRLLEILGMYELELLFNMQVLLSERLNLNPYDRMNESNEEIGECIFFNGIRDVIKLHPGIVNGEMVLALLKGEENIPFNETFEIVDDSATFIIVKEGFSNYLNVAGRYKLLKELVDAKEKTIGDRIYKSSVTKGLIKEKLSN